MAEQHAVHRYDPLWDSGRKINAKGRGARVAIGLSIAAHLGLGYYIYETKFVPHYKVYQGDQAIVADIIDLTPPPPPPEPPKPQEARNQPPPPRVAENSLPISVRPAIR